MNPQELIASIRMLKALGARLYFLPEDREKTDEYVRTLPARPAEFAMYGFDTENAAKRVLGIVQPLSKRNHDINLPLWDGEIKSMMIDGERAYIKHSEYLHIQPCVNIGKPFFYFLFGRPLDLSSPIFMGLYDLREFPKLQFNHGESDYWLLADIERFRIV